jgi:hypothetical protein
MTDRGGAGFPEGARMAAGGEPAAAVGAGYAWARRPHAAVTGGTA